MKRMAIMRKCVGLIALLEVYSFNASAIILTVPQKPQEETNWCWAATSEAVLAYYGVSKSQTVIAAYGTPGEYNVKNYIYGQTGTRKGVDLILSEFGNIYTTGNPYPADKDSVVISINSYRNPVVIRWLKNDDPDDGHILLIKGVNADYWQTLYLTLMDPSVGTYTQSYEWVIGHSWTNTLSVTGKTQPVPDHSMGMYPSSLNPQNGTAPAINLPSMLSGNPDWDGVRLTKQ